MKCGPVNQSGGGGGGEPVDMHAYRSVCVHESEISKNSRTSIVGR